MDKDRWRQLGDLFHTALETPREERNAFLDRVCPDAALRVQLESLLAQGTGEDLFESGSNQLGTGSMLGPYRILSELGSGGMGVVYKALDTRLDRAVALKVLPEHIARNEEVLRRFAHEARAVASLNHPNICVLHDFGNQGQTGYMVMEFIDGETLAARVAKGPVPLARSIEIAMQVADALDRAHRAGVTHRDVKPGNIMLTRDGAKLLDFGLAKTASERGPLSKKDITAVGAVIGTPQYMAPEQFEGLPADARTDVWAFGAVLYEMVTGRKAFEGKSYSTLVGAILSTEPRPMTLPASAPAWLERLVRRCLSKDPEDRYQSMRDVVLELRSPTPEPVVAGKSNRWPWLALAVCGVATALLALPMWRARPAGELPAKFEIYPPPGGRFGGATAHTEGSAISPDGRTLAYMATDGNGERLLHVRSLEALESRALAGTEGAGRPFWSPNSKSLGFAAGGKLKRVDIVGGLPLDLCDVLIPRGGTWSEGGVILFSDAAVGLMRVSESGGSPVQVTTVSKAAGEHIHVYPQFLPGGKQFLYLVRHGESSQDQIVLGALDGRPPLAIQHSQFNGIYDAAFGRLLYVQSQGTLMARRFDPVKALVFGDPVVVAERVAGVIENGYVEASVSRTGTLLYARGAVGRKTRFNWRDRTGKMLGFVGLAVDPGDGYALSPDERRLAYTSGREQADIWLMAVDSGVTTRLTFGRASRPKWSPDGKTIYFTKLTGLFQRPADGSGEEKMLVEGGAHEFPQAVSPDGKHLLYGFTDILTLPLQGGMNPQPYLRTNARELSAVISPDGRWVAYQSDESGRNEVYIQGYPEKRGKWHVSAEGGQFPRWRGDGRELYWMAADNRTLMATQLELQTEGVKLGRSEGLFRLAVGVNAFNFQPTPDGRRFLMREPDSAEQAEFPMVVVERWGGASQD